MIVRFIYRNYRPIHSIFQSMINDPPTGVEYRVSQPNIALRRFLPIYRRFGNVVPIKLLIKKIQPIVFSRNTEPDADLLHVVDMVLEKNMRVKPYVVDIGHIMALANHSSIDDTNRQEIKEYLLDMNCKFIIARSQAALGTIKTLFSNEYSNIKDKCIVIYPAYKPAVSKEEVIANLRRKNSSDELRLLFVGNGAWGKGLGELLSAYKQLQKRPNIKMSLDIISNDGEEVLKMYKGLPNVRMHLPRYTNKELLTEFFFTRHLLVLPSHHEIFGMVFLDALCSGTPTIAIDQYSTSEIIDDHADGVLVRAKTRPFNDLAYPGRSAFSPDNFKIPDPIVVRGLVESIGLFLQNRKLILEYGVAGTKKIFNPGKFSITKRNQALKRVYEKAIL